MTEIAPTALEECEAIIERGLRTFVEVGEALLRIRDERLYRDSHGTFEDYCRQRWQMGRPRAHRLIVAAEVAAETVPMGTTPQSERVARELAPLRAEPETLRETWAEVVETHGEKPTAKQVREVVSARGGATPPPQPSWAARMLLLADELRSIARAGTVDSARCRAALELLAGVEADLRHLAAGTAQPAPETATPPRLAADEPAQEHNAETQTMETTRDVEKGENDRAASETRDETTQEGAKAITARQRMADIRRRMSAIRRRSGQKRKNARNGATSGRRRPSE